MTTDQIKRLHELSDALESGAIRDEEKRELASLAREAAKTLSIVRSYGISWRTLYEMNRTSTSAHWDAIRRCANELLKVFGE